MGGNLLAFFNDKIAGLGNRSAAAHQRFGAARASAHPQLIGINLHEFDFIKGDTKLSAQNLPKGCGMALPVIMRSGEQCHCAIFIEGDLAQFARHRRGHFNKLTNATPAQFALVRTVLLPRGKAIPISKVESLAEDGWEIAGIIS